MGEALRKARRARGWSQERLIREIEGYARSRLTDVASTASLRVYVSEWENGKRAISDRYGALLRPLLGLTDAELRPADPAPSPVLADGYDALLQRIDSARSVGPSMVATFMDQTELLRSMDRQMGAPALVDQMTGHLAAMEEALSFAVLPDSRRPVALALAGAASLAAWQSLDAGAIERAWQNYELAKRAAQEADAPMYLAHAMGEQAYVLLDAGRPQLAVDLVREARKAGGSRVTPRLHSWLFAAEAELCAQAGRPEEARQAIEQAIRVMPHGPDARDPDMLSIFLNEGHLARWRGNVLALLGDDQAVTDLYGALEVMDPTFIRAQAGVRCDLAQAHRVRGEYDQAADQLRQARSLATRTGSVRHRRRVDLLSGGAL